MTIIPNSVQAASESLTIVWSNGETRVYPALLLRQMCPCAKCVSEITGEVLLDRASLAGDITLTTANPVGHYGVALGFSDAHASGIYGYTYLFEMPKQGPELLSEPHAHSGCGCGHSH